MVLHIFTSAPFQAV